MGSTRLNVRFWDGFFPNPGIQRKDAKTQGRKACLCVSAPLRLCVESLNIQILHIERIVFNELAPRFHVFAH